MTLQWGWELLGRGAHKLQNTLCTGTSCAWRVFLKLTRIFQVRVRRQKGTEMVHRTIYHSFEIHWTVLFPFRHPPTNNWLPLETVKVKINELEKKLKWFTVASLGSSLSSRPVAAGSTSHSWTLASTVSFALKISKEINTQILRVKHIMLTVSVPSPSSPNVCNKPRKAAQTGLVLSRLTGMLRVRNEAGSGRSEDSLQSWSISSTGTSVVPSRVVRRSTNISASLSTIVAFL